MPILSSRQLRTCLSRHRGTQAQRGVEEGLEALFLPLCSFVPLCLCASVPLRLCLHMPFYFIQKSDLTGGAVHIGMPLAHHLIDVLRYQKGDSLTLVDQDRNKYVARIRSITSRSIEGEVLSKDTPPQQQKPILHLGIAILKGDKMDWAIQKATELGVERISPLMTRRVVAKVHNNKIAHQQKRWFEIAKEGSQPVSYTHLTLPTTPYV